MESPIIFLCLFTCLTVHIVSVDGTSYDTRIDNFLKTYLPKKHRPIIWEDTVYVFAELYNIIAINEKKETITTKLWNYVSYVVDVPEEAWDNLTDTYMYEFYPGKDSIWKPDIIVLNNVEVVETSFENPIVQRAFNCPNTTYCYTAGALVVYPFAQTQITTCSFDVTSFPFDNQDCKIEGATLSRKTVQRRTTKLSYYFLVTIGLIGISLIYNTININLYYYNYVHIFKAVFKKGGAKTSKDDDLIAPKNLDKSIEILGKLVGEIGGSESDESEEKRRQNCIVMDHIFGTVMLLVILIVTGVFFLPEV
ncbi:acetylcholine receptor subunit epsilon-like [Convolutriloba macropyga]|uniref:acetylcholine receptor subunit epsilon-like n=1 Tax=Convolutriloba macropyga TaxID=536237 RepID=UPI003F522721